MACPGHHWNGPYLYAWAVPAPGPTAASANPPGNSIVAASRANPRFMDVTVCPVKQVRAAIGQDRETPIFST
jgi:hypothetical protein